MMPVNNLQKDSKSSDALIRANAIKLLTDMCSNLNDIFPFIYEIIKGGIYDANPFVK
jgi:vesicle coat complex subunit